MVWRGSTGHTAWIAILWFMVFASIGRTLLDVVYVNEDETLPGYPLGKGAAGAGATGTVGAEASLMSSPGKVI